MMDLFKPFKNIIETAMNNTDYNKRSTNTTLSNSAAKPSFSLSDYSRQKSELTISSNLSDIASQIGAIPYPFQQIGKHPDFINLEGTNNYEKHWIISCFIDIKRSTALYKYHTPETVMIITQSLQMAAIKVCIQFGGFIQRLHGDGLLVYFGGKNKEVSQSINHALTALGFFSYFMENDLKDVFSIHGADKIYSRTGIDLGYDNDVIWAMAGIEKSSEIATYSLHTNLAAKMQEYATNNGITVGQHVKDNNQLKDESLYSITDRRYIFQNPDANFNYTQYQFNWYKFLQKQDYIASSTNGTISLKNDNTTTVLNKVAESLRPIVGAQKPWGY